VDRLELCWRISAIEQVAWWHLGFVTRARKKGMRLYEHKKWEVRGILSFHLKEIFWPSGSNLFRIVMKLRWEWMLFHCCCSLHSELTFLTLYQCGSRSSTLKLAMHHRS
jgi:hypothetical protein